VLLNDRIEGSLDGGLHLGVEEEQLFEAPLNDVNTVLEVGLSSRRGLSGWFLAVELGIDSIGKKPVHGDEHEMSKKLLSGAALGLGMEILDAEESLADFVAIVRCQALVQRLALPEGCKKCFFPPSRYR
jgi:hypothetical protein